MTIGFRIPGALSRIPFADLAAWAKSAGFDSIDLGGPDAERVGTLKANGLEVGTIDLPGTRELLSPDAEVRAQGIATASAALEAIAAVGGDKAFCTFFPANADQSRAESLRHWSESFPAVGAVAKRLGIRFAVEGWPGPKESALGVTPETLRAMFAADPTGTLGINYDPSHLIRIGVDHRRFLREFAGKVVHAHGKDTAPDAEGLYLYGHLGPSVDKTVGWGGGHWRYTIPGEGSADWVWITAELDRVGFDGTIAIELEDYRYNNTEAGEKEGLSRARANLLNLL
ncbi:MAG: sugar phosphate isomerase/epimerase family protein [Armatimonadota bacterium]